VKIVLITPETSTFHSYTGGIGVQFEATARGLAEFGHDVTLLTSTRSLIVGATSPYLGRVRVLPIELPRPFHPLYPRHDSQRIADFVSAMPNVDVVYAAEWAGLASRWSRLRDRPPLVTTLQTSLQQVREIEAHDTGLPKPSLPDRYVYRLERNQAVNSQVVCACSSSVLAWAIRLWGPLPRSRVLPNFIDVKETTSVAAEPIDLPSPLKPNGYVVATGRVSSWKGADVLVDAMVQLWRQGMTAPVVFVGSVMDDFRESLERAAADFGDRLILLGQQPRNTLLKLVKQARLAVFPSRYEAFGVGALEAKSVGTPSIVTSGSGFSDFCTGGEDCLMVPPGDSGALASAVAEFLTSDSTAERLGEAGASTAAAYDWREVIPTLVQSFDESMGCEPK
jgi:glycogen(starch) synthase